MQIVHKQKHKCKQQVFHICQLSCFTLCLDPFTKPSTTPAGSIGKLHPSHPAAFFYIHGEFSGNSHPIKGRGVNPLIILQAESTGSHQPDNWPEILTCWIPVHFRTSWFISPSNTSNKKAKNTGNKATPSQNRPFAARFCSLWASCC